MICLMNPRREASIMSLVMRIAAQTIIMMKSQKNSVMKNSTLRSERIQQQLKRSQTGKELRV